MRFPLAIHKEAGSCYGVTVPDVPGCFSAGDTLDEAIANAQEAIAAHLELLIEGGGALPKPAAIEQRQADPDYDGAIWAVAEVDLSRLEDKVERVNITLPRRVLARLDARAKAAGETRSGYIAKRVLAD